MYAISWFIFFSSVSSLFLIVYHVFLVNKDYYSRGNEIPEGNAVKTGIAVVLGGTSDFAPGYVP